MAMVTALTVSFGLVAAPAPAHAAPKPSQGSGKVHSTHASLKRTRTLPDAASDKARQARDKIVSLADVTVDTPTAVVGVTWQGSALPEVLYRTTSNDGEVSEWHDVDASAVSQAEAGTSGSEPIVVAGVARVEVATLSAAPLEADVSLYSSTSATDSAAITTQAATTNSVAYDVLKPAIRSRAAWGANESIVGLPYEEGIVTGAMIHHTAGTNSYTAADVPGLLRSIQAYHVNSRGWKDIGYNVLVDRFGTAWEGRGGGLDRAIAGGHALGVTNSRVFGLSFMGDFDQVSPPAAMIATGNSVIAWKFAIHGVNPYGSTFGSGGQDGGSTFLNAISAHRDENATNCPGATVYAMLPQIRASVKSKLDTVSYTVVQPQPTPVTEVPSPSPVDGKITLETTGFLDKGTVIEMQKWLGTAADGVWGRETNLALQRRVGATQTGARDTQTVTALQGYLGVSRSGVLDPTTIQALQRHLNARPAPYAAVTGQVIYAAHSANRGWMRGVADGATAGTVGEGLRMEALRLALGSGLSGDILTSAHVSGVGWRDPVGTSRHAGTVGQQRSLEAVRLTLSGPVAAQYSIRYRAHVGGLGWQPWVTDGATAGTTGQSRQLEAIQVVLVAKATPTPTPSVTPTVTPTPTPTASPTPTPTPTTSPSPTPKPTTSPTPTTPVTPNATASYSVHSQDIGWGPTLTSGAAGTIGKRAEALRFKVSAPGISGDVSYRAHVQDIGWMSPSTSANAIGTSGRGLRMEAFQISLTGELATRYSVRYRAYVRGIGWQAWVTDGATAGTTGQGRQIEAIEITVVTR